MLEERALWSTVPPAPRDRMQNQPTLLFSWWCTSFSAAIILTRICGRKIRSNELFREDWIMMLALIPLFARMAIMHWVLIYRTNNVNTIGHTFTVDDLYHRSIGSRLVLAGRIFYAMFIWICKLTVSEFLKRITIRIWRPAYETTLKSIRIFLLITFLAVVVATLTECSPFGHYWQVIPDPGPRCRLGYAHLLTMGACDVITDVLLILFPIPLVLKSGQTWQRKLQLILLFSLSIVMIGITVTRMNMVILHGGLQQYRTVWASCEILASAAACNAVILGSFVRDKGTKRNRYVSYSVSDSIDRVSTRRPTLCSYGSDEQLFRSMGLRIPDDLRSPSQPTMRPAPLVSPCSPLSPATDGLMFGRYNDQPMAGHALGRILPSPSISTNRSVSLADATTHSEDDGGDDVELGRATAPLQMTPSDSSVVAYDFAVLAPSRSRRSIGTNSSQEVTVFNSRLRRNSVTQTPFQFLPYQRNIRSQPHVPPVGIQRPVLDRHGTEHSLQDAGGLLQGVPTLPVTHDHFGLWQQPNLEMTRSATGPTVTFSDSGQTPQFEDVGGLLSKDGP